MTEETRKKLNAERLKLVDVSIRKKVASCLATLEHYGHRPLIAPEVWRDPATQMSMYRRGVSKVKWGFHCATDAKGKPASLAADIVDAEKMWDAPRSFWLTLGYAAHAQGLGWGGQFDLTAPMKKALLEAFDWVRHQVDHPNLVAPNPKIGWDPAHVQTAAVSIAEARAGKR
jgi:hypothetical protein